MRQSNFQKDYPRQFEAGDAFVPAMAADCVTLYLRDGLPVEYHEGDYLFNLAGRVLEYVRRADAVVDTALLERTKYLKLLHDNRPIGSVTAKQDEDLGYVLGELHTNSPVQQAFAYIADYVPSRWLLEQEAATICERRVTYGRNSVPWLSQSARSPESAKEPVHPGTTNVYTWAGQARLQGLCMSGGGIRSATFNLGILQGLAAQKKLEHFDYLSSVSGGGYIHGWLVAWLKRESTRQGEKKPAPTREAAAKAALREVEAKMTPLPGAGRATPPNLFATAEIRWLRRYSNYLTPRKGLLSLDTWTAIAIWLRNTVLNQIVLVAGLLCVLLVPWILSSGLKTHAPVPSVPALRAQQTASLQSTDRLAAAAAGACQRPPTDAEAVKANFLEDYRSALREEAGFLMPPAMPSAAAVAPQTPTTQLTAAQQFIREFGFLYDRESRAVLSLLLFCAGAIGLGVLVRREYDFTRELDEMRETAKSAKVAGQPQSTSPCGPPPGKPERKRDFDDSLQTCFLVGAIMLPALVLCRDLCFPGPSLADLVRAALALLVLAASVARGGRAFYWLRMPLQPKRRHPFETICCQALVSVGAALLGTVVYALAAALVHTAAVEQWGLGALGSPVPGVELVFGVPLLASIPFLTVTFVLGLVGGSFADWLRELLGRILAMTLLIALAWLAFFSVSLLSPGFFYWALKSPYLKVPAVLGWLLTTAGAVASGKSSQTHGAGAAPSAGSRWTEWIALIGPYVYIVGLLVALSCGVHAWVNTEDALLRVVGTFAGCFFTCWLFGWRLDANSFSMFPFYRNRLVRCYLGASNRDRVPSSLTGFDDRDTRGLQLRCLTPAEGYPGPMPIFCATLNLATGKDLAYQERKGASFAFTPLYTGYTAPWTEGEAGTQFNGFVPTRLYAGADGGLNIATAIAVSGAAVAPNWGYHTNPATAFLLTMFNARLGCWLPNTRRQRSTGRRLDTPTEEPVVASPNGSVLLSELLGMSDDGEDFVYLTDGGHFDNMGVYELVRRRCHNITICDAEEDEGYIFEGIGASIRKCRIDFGVEICLDFSQLRLVAKTTFSSAHVVTGTICYPETQGKELGHITYVKASLIESVLDKVKGGKKPEPSDLPKVPGDVQNYWLQHKNFPHDSTLNQWFTESQFESYRRLGEATVAAVWPVRPAGSQGSKLRTLKRP